MAAEAATGLASPAGAFEAALILAGTLVAWACAAPGIVQHSAHAQAAQATNDLEIWLFIFASFIDWIPYHEEHRDPWLSLQDGACRCIDQGEMIIMERDL
jgi:hypothetical protein